MNLTDMRKTFKLNWPKLREFQLNKNILVMRLVVTIVSLCIFNIVQKNTEN